ERAELRARDRTVVAKRIREPATRAMKGALRPLDLERTGILEESRGNRRHRHARPALARPEREAAVHLLIREQPGDSALRVLLRALDGGSETDRGETLLVEAGAVHDVEKHEIRKRGVRELLRAAEGIRHELARRAQRGAEKPREHPHAKLRPLR